MAKMCENCDKTYVKSATRSHSHIKTLRRKYANLQWVRIDGERFRYCAKCIKRLAKNKADKLETKVVTVAA